MSNEPDPTEEEVEGDDVPENPEDHDEADLDE